MSTGNTGHQSGAGSDVKVFSQLRKCLPMALLVLPGAAHAHAIPPIAIGLALSPVVALILACIYGFLAGRWRVLTAHLILISLWVILFGLAANFATSDYVIWTPIAAMMGHIAILLVLIAWKAIKGWRKTN